MQTHRLALPVTLTTLYTFSSKMHLNIVNTEDIMELCALLSIAAFLLISLHEVLSLLRNMISNWLCWPVLQTKGAGTDVWGDLPLRKSTAALTLWNRSTQSTSLSFNFTSGCRRPTRRQHINYTYDLSTYG